MEYDKKLNDTDNFIAFFREDNYNIELNPDLKDIYEIKDIQYEEQVKLEKLRNDNHKKYHKIDILKIENLPNEFSVLKNDILNLYNCIDSLSLLKDSMEDALNNKKILDGIYKKYSTLDKIVEFVLRKLELKNDRIQKKLNIAYLKKLHIDAMKKKELLSIYEDLVIYNSRIETDKYENLKRQIVRNLYISKIFKILNIKYDNNIFNIHELNMLNKKINSEIIKYKDKIEYLKSLINSNSKYTLEFNDFISSYNKVIAYDDTNYCDILNVYQILIIDNYYKKYIKLFEDRFIDEIDSIKKEEKFIYEKVGIKNLKKSLDYISNNYIEILDDQNKKTVEEIYKELDSNEVNINECNRKLKNIVRPIWKNEITDIYSYDPNKDFKFICTNNQFRDPKYQAILITKKELERVTDFSDYQIGFICEFNDNILYITENEDIMTVDFDDMSNLKTPIQLEQEFLNFKVCNRIALNGYMTSISAVYIIEDNDYDKYLKAVELANMYKLPLIVLKKDNQ